MELITHLQKAMKICGGTQAALAEKTGLTQAAVSYLLTGKNGISPETAIKIEEATNGKVSRKHLRPDLFGASQ